jgi:hypothetical protein
MGKMEYPSDRGHADGAEHRRWVRIAIAYSLASLASGYTFVLVLLALTRGDLPGLGRWWVLPVGGFLSATVICFLTALPAVYVISLAETYRLRSPAFYAAAGAGVALVPLVLIFLLYGGSSPERPSSVGAIAGALLMLGVPGVIGGLVYWWVAGRTAGALPLSPQATLSASDQKPKTLTADPQ